MLSLLNYTRLKFRYQSISKKSKFPVGEILDSSTQNAFEFNASRTNSLCIAKARRLQDTDFAASYINPTGYYSGADESEWILPRKILETQPTSTDLRSKVTRAPFRKKVSRYSY